MNPTVERTIGLLKQLRATLAHALKQPNISPIRFNDARELMLGLDEQLRNLGVTGLEVLPQMAPTYVRPTRHQRRAAAKKRNHASFTVRMNQRAGNAK